MTLLWISIGSLAGTFLRYISSITLNSIYPAIPLGTLLVNLVGSFLIGIVLGFAHSQIIIPDPIKIGITVGFLGSLTTFSAFSAEVMTLLLAHEYVKGFVLGLLHVGGGLLVTYLGVVLMMFIMRP